ncbi:MAG: flagellar biosynthetic protein FliO [Spirochaetales bacterium]|nr:flagellar biosynthetic protein FliO [Spirochaetales bacterium]
MPLYTVSAQDNETAAPVPTPVDEKTLLIEDVQPQPSETDTQPSGDLIPVWDYVKMILALAAVIGVIYFVFFLIKKNLKKKIPENDLIRILGTRVLHGNTMLHVIQIGTGLFLVGSGEGSPSLITEITDKESIDTILLKANESTPVATKSFSEMLSNIFNPGKGGGKQNLNPLNFFKNQRERLKKLK